MRGVNNMKKTITLTFLCIILLFSGCANNMTNKYNDKLLSDTEYVKSHILGVWSSSDGEIVEFYSNGIVVNYTQNLKVSDTAAIQYQNPIHILMRNYKAIPIMHKTVKISELL